MKITDKYIFFWKEWPSNWHRAFIEWDGRSWPTSEHVFMAMKAKLFGDKDIYDSLWISKDPREAQQLGRAIKNFNQKSWDENKYEFMCRANYLKYIQNLELLQKLSELGKDNKIFVEASPYDKVWGIGMAENDPNIEDETYWKGENLLGKCLNEIVMKLFLMNKEVVDIK